MEVLSEMESFKKQKVGIEKSKKRWKYREKKTIKKTRHKEMWEKNRTESSESLLGADKKDGIDSHPEIVFVDGDINSDNHERKHPKRKKNNKRSKNANVPWSKKCKTNLKKNWWRFLIVFAQTW